MASSVMAVSNETSSSMTRSTKDGRTLQYTMSVVQQPERARACGAGAKCKMHSLVFSPSRADNITASADRRPVDPPPIVDLQIFEGTGEDKKDTTFSHQANCFLYTTLEHARPINQ